MMNGKSYAEPKNINWIDYFAALDIILNHETLQQRLLQPCMYNTILSFYAIFHCASWWQSIRITLSTHFWGFRFYKSFLNDWNYTVGEFIGGHLGTWNYRRNIPHTVMTKMYICVCICTYIAYMHMYMHICDLWNICICIFVYVSYACASFPSILTISGRWGANVCKLQRTCGNELVSFSCFTSFCLLLVHFPRCSLSVAGIRSNAPLTVKRLKNLFLDICRLS